MTDYLTEQEQIELFKNWVKQYSLVILMGILVAAIFISGWRFWHHRQIKTGERASAIYDEMLLMRSQNDPEAAFVQAKKLFSRYPKTTYGQMAALMLSRDAVIKKDYPEAEKQLHWVLQHSPIPSFKQVARIRLARVLIAENKPQEGLKILQKVEDKSFNGLTDEVKGDAYLAMKNLTFARESYRSALAELPNAEIVRPLLQMKYDNLATVK